MPCNRTEVIIIGNGPSGICLSFFLSGQLPFYNGMRHPNEFLHYKLTEKPGASIIEQNLQYLSEGLEGRSPNPVSLLFDALTHADADIGANHPSFLTWKRDDKQSVPHVVLGKTAPGGAWQKIEGNMQTLSLSCWMELPSLPFKEWLASRRGNSTSSNNHNNNNNNNHINNHNNNHYERAWVADIRDYYTDYVQTTGLTKYFRDHCTVTSVRKVYNMRTCIDSDSGEVEPCCQNVKKNHAYVWEVRGFRLKDNGDASDVTGREEFCYIAPNVVLATGAFDSPNQLRVPGEDLPYVLHTMKEYEDVVKRRGDLRSPDSDPVVVIGAGLTAADAVIASIENRVAVEHVFRQTANDSSLIYHQLPKALYPDYHRLHEMMKGNDAMVHAGVTKYTPHDAHNVVEFSHDRKVLISRHDQERILHCSYALVLIGSKPDLTFMPDECRNLGVVRKQRIHFRHNPIDVDPFTYQSVHEPGLYAIGPLVGDTFVRFVRGGALGVASHLWQKRHDDKTSES